MVASGIQFVAAPVFAQRRTTEFAHPHDKRILQQSPVTKICHQCCPGGIEHSPTYLVPGVEERDRTMLGYETVDPGYQNRLAHMAIVRLVTVGGEANPALRQRVVGKESEYLFDVINFGVLGDPGCSRPFRLVHRPGVAMPSMS